MGKLINRKLPAASLIEVLISMVIILVIFVISIKIFTNVYRTSTSNRKLKINYHLNYLIEQVKKEGAISSKALTIDSVEYVFSVVELESKGLSQVVIKAIENEVVIDSMKSYFIRSNNEFEN